MIDQLAGSGGSLAAAQAQSAAPSGGMSQAMGRDDFLQLLVAQLKNQDPLSPSNPEEFASQLAQFSSLEQLLNIQTSIDEQRELQQAVLQEAHATSALEMVGRQVMAQGNGLALTGDPEQTLTLGVGGSGGQVEVTFLDAEGQAVHTAQVGWLGAGRHDLRIGDLAPDLEPGSYTLEVRATTEGGSTVETSTFAQHTIDGVRWGQNGPVLLSGSFEILLGDVIEVKRP